MSCSLLRSNTADTRTERVAENEPVAELDDVADDVPELLLLAVALEVTLADEVDDAEEVAVDEDERDDVRLDVAVVLCVADGVDV